MPETSA